MANFDNLYLAKRGSSSYATLASMFDGLKILSVTGMDERGKPTNVYTEKWINSQAEDYAIGNGDNTIVYENVDIEITFEIADKYASGNINVRAIHDAFIAYMTNGALYIRSLYEGKEVRCVCVEDYKPTLTKLRRARGHNFMLGTIKLHTLDMPTDIAPTEIINLYIGFGAATISSMSDILGLTNVEHYEVVDEAGAYDVTATTTSYLWICTEGGIEGVTSSNFEVPMNAPTRIGDYFCYRSANSIAAGLMEFNIVTNNG